MVSRDEQFDQAFKQLATDVVSTLAMEHALNGKGPLKVPKTRGRSKKAAMHAASSDLYDVEPRDPVEIALAVLSACNRKRKATVGSDEVPITDEVMSEMARFTDKFKLKPYENFLHYVPRLVNVVTVRAFPLHLLHLLQTLHTLCSISRLVLADASRLLRAQLAEAIPVSGSGTSLPLDLHRIAARCRNSYYAPKKFSAVQLAYSEPRCRVLLFHTGRLVGTGVLILSPTLTHTHPHSPTLTHTLPYAPL